MKKVNLLSKAEMRNVLGGNVDAGICDDWRKSEFLTCFNCCITVHSTDDCLKTTNCGPSPIVVNG